MNKRQIGQNKSSVTQITKFKEEFLTFIIIKITFKAPYYKISFLNLETFYKTGIEDFAFINSFHESF